MNEQLQDGEFFAALDLSGARIRFAVADHAMRTVCTVSREMKKRDASSFPVWMTEVLAHEQIPLSAIKRWTSGSGPGSFTGMRLTAALIAGMTQGIAEIKTRTVPTAVAIASQIPATEAQTLALLFDGRNHEVLLFPMRRMESGEVLPDGEGIVLNQEQAADYFAKTHFDTLGVLACEQNAVQEIVPEAITGALAVVEDFDLLPLIRASKAYDNNLKDLVYIRPAVFTAPVVEKH